MPQRKKSVQKSDPTSAQILPPLNTDVISSICPWLPLPDVKNCRLVSRTWNVAAKPILQKKSIIRLNCDFDKKEIARNAKFQREMASFGGPLHHVEIRMGDYKIRPVKNDPEFSVDDFKKRKVYLDDVHFFAKCLSMQKLGIRGYLEWAFIFEFIENVLLSCSSNLVEVGMDMRIQKNLGKNDFPPEFCDGKVFNTVKKLELSFFAVNKELGVVKVPQILAAFPNIVDLRVSGNLLPVLFPEGSVSPRFLSKLWAKEDMSGFKCTALLNLTQPLKHLHIERAFNPRGAKYGEGNDDVDVAPVLYEVLSKHCHTLEYLDLDLDKFSVWNLPNFPNLKRFNFIGDLYAVVTFESEIINYSETFPNLESLGFTPWDGDWMPCYKSFFPSRATICQSVTTLSISDEFEPDIFSEMFSQSESGGRIDARFGRILKLFSNADNLFMQELKRYLVKKRRIPK
ncbi:hypothetical protein Fcan01_15404 [Folsomia candida]|uniref:F-box domain-containing protein n=1 Tax=Folsomia candida TaxID=158441 RepID=A0A226DZ05_FOLCA|nr:hypothetical protein Fcan01_15404 [Folsomia candida]